MTLDLVRLLERRPIDALDEGLGDRADRPELDRIVAFLVAARARTLGGIDLTRAS